MEQKDKDLQLITDLRSFILRTGVTVSLPNGKTTPNPALKFLSWMLNFKQLELPDFHANPVLSEKETG